MIFQLFKWHFDINWYKFEKRWADVFQIYPNAIHFNPPRFCPSLYLLSFPVFCLSFSIVLSRYFVISVNSMTTWSMLKLPKIEWPSPFKLCLQAQCNNSHLFHKVFSVVNTIVFYFSRLLLRTMFTSSLSHCCNLCSKQWWPLTGQVSWRQVNSSVYCFSGLTSILVH